MRTEFSGLTKTFAMFPFLKLTRVYPSGRGPSSRRRSLQAPFLIVLESIPSEGTCAEPHLNYLGGPDMEPQVLSF